MITLGKGKYKFVLDGSIVIHLPLIDGMKQLEGEYEWGTIYGNRLWMRDGYAWDGCSPKYKVMGKWLGTWDGYKGRAAIPSLVHDFMIQCVPISRKTMDKMFLLLMLKHTNSMVMSYMYYGAVRAYANVKGLV